MNSSTAQFLDNDLSLPLLGQLRSTLGHWIDLNMDRTRWGEDAPWWYNERASLSQFAGAIWKAGGWVFEEYTVAKKRPVGNGRFCHPTKAELAGEKSPRGRVDLAFEVPRLRGIVESKIVWLPASQPNAEYSDKLDAEMATAHEQVRHYPNGNGWYRRFGVLFLVPIVSKQVVKGELVERRVQRVIDQAVSQDGWAVAWAFPKRTRRLRSKKGGYYPGSVVCVAEAPPTT